jgi:hypothetical protein
MKKAIEQIFDDLHYELITEKQAKQMVLDAVSKGMSDFCDHLNTYEGLEDCRFDFMLIDYLDKL